MHVWAPIRHFCVCPLAPLRAPSALSGRASGELARKTPIKDLKWTELSQPHCALFPGTRIKALCELGEGGVLSFV